MNISRKGKKYIREDNNYIKKYYGKITGKLIAKNLGRNEDALQMYAHLKLGLNSRLGKTHFTGRKHTSGTLKKMSNGKKGKLNPFWHKKHKKSTLKLIGKNSIKMWKGNRERLSRSIKISQNRPEVIDKLRKASINLWKKKSYRNKVRKAIINGINIKPTRPEIIIKQICDKNNLKFNYTGNGNANVGGFNPDFINSDKSKIIEVYGEYWHKRKEAIERNKRREETYRILGKKCLILWEFDIYENPQKITERIVNFYAQ